MQRVRWLSLGGLKKGQLANLSAGMLERRYSEENGSGFLLTTTRPGTVEGKFLERFQINESVEDPFGGKKEYARINYRHVAFRISVTGCELEIFDGASSQREFFNELSRMSKRTISIVKCRADVVRWCASISKRCDEATVSALTISNLVVSKTVSAKVCLLGSDIQSAIKTLTGSRKYEVERLVVAWDNAGTSQKVELHRDGRAKILSGNAESSLLILRSTLPDALISSAI